MPQMSPLKWIFLYIFFSTVFLSFNIINFYSFTSSAYLSSTKLLKSTPNFSWKW